MNVSEFPKISIRKGRDWQIKRGHPWLFSGAISQAPKNVAPGSLVDLVDVEGTFVGRGFYNDGSDIAVRVLTTDGGEQIDKKFFQRRIKSAMASRMQKIDKQETNVFRLVNAEGDYLPGFIVDCFDDVLSVQSHTAGSDQLLDLFLCALSDEMTPKAIIVRNDVGARRRENLAIEEARLFSGFCDERMQVKENGIPFYVNPLKGQKTGFFTDQRDKRLALADYCRSMPADAVLLNCYSYSASFSVYALCANANLRTINVDSSDRALTEAQANYDLNAIEAGKHLFICQDVFQFFDKKDQNEKFDVVVLDPPAFAKTNKDKPRALKAYIRMIKNGIDACKTGALMVIASCSGAVSMSDLEECLRDAAGDTRRPVQIIEYFRHGVDHPVSAAAPETSYLKVLFCRVS